MGRIWELLWKLHRYNLTHGYYPDSVQSACYTLLVTACLHFMVNSTPEKDSLGNIIPEIFGGADRETSLCKKILAILIAWFLICLVRKFLTRQVLRYTGWIYEGKTQSRRTEKVFYVLKTLMGWEVPIPKNLYHCQGILPSLPVPKLKSTVEKYLASMKPLLDKEAYASIEQKAKEFQLSTGPRLQWCLYIKKWLTTNYISDWWEKYAYLYDRSSLLKSNCFSQYVRDQSARSNHKTASEAAIIVHCVLKFRELIERNELAPLVGKGVVPFCSWQYERLFNTCRIPGEDVDSLQHQVFSDFIVCQHRGRYFKVGVYKERSRAILSPTEFQVQFQRIMADDSELAEGEDRLHALTAWDRTNWAKARKEFFATGVNKSNLDAIEKSAFVLHLDENPADKEMDAFAKYELAGLRATHGTLWLDKSFNLIVRGNEVHVNAELSWGDFSMVAHMCDFAFSRLDAFTKIIDRNGYVINLGQKHGLPLPERLQWNLQPDCIKAIQSADREREASATEFDLKVTDFKGFGKGFMKKMNISPDAFIQMALQLAYYRDQRKFALTYEPCMTRMFFRGQTDTLRSCTEGSCKWVISMMDGSDRQLKKHYFKAACDMHQCNFRKTVTGEGFDRHLFGLFVVAKYFKISSPFLNKAFSFPWLLSTSQGPSNTKENEMIGRPGWGLVIGSEDGYGVGYYFCSQDRIYFQVTCNRSCSETDSARFTDSIQRALYDAASLLLPDQSLSQKPEENVIHEPGPGLTSIIIQS